MFNRKLSCTILSIAIAYHHNKQNNTNVLIFRWQNYGAEWRNIISYNFSEIFQPRKNKSKNLLKVSNFRESRIYFYFYGAFTGHEGSTSAIGELNGKLIV